MKAISIRQPYAHLILEGLKRDEFRSWTTDYRGPLLIHAGQKIDELDGLTRRQLAAIPDELDTGGFLGIVDLVHIKDWFDVDYQATEYVWRFANPRRIVPVAANGRLRLFDAPDKIALNLI